MTRTNQANNIPGEITQLENRYPIALLPVRLETRFSGNVLKVRIYPDVIHFDRHERQLTDAEYNAGKVYWQSVWTEPNEETAREAWRKLLRLFSAQRVAWIVEATKPTNFDNLHTSGSTPTFPAHNRRAAVWTRPIQARALPHRWLVILYGKDGTERCRVESRPVQSPLAVTFDPSITPAADADALTLIRDDPDAGWMVDYGRAEAIGMAVTITGLSADDLRDGFSRLLVLGVKTSLNATDSGALLADLFDAHHYTGGLSFVAQGAPTNNVAGLPSAYPPGDPDGRNSFRIERGIEWKTDEQLRNEQLAADHDGYRFASALRLPMRVVEHIDRAREGEQLKAQAMNDALWPATLGYFIEQMLAAGVGTKWVNDRLVEWALMPAVRDFFVRWVHGRGPYPAFRVGAMPYGLLPVTSMNDWEWPATTPYGFNIRLVTVEETIISARFAVQSIEGRVIAGGQSWSLPFEPWFFDAPIGGKAGITLGDADGDGSDELGAVLLRGGPRGELEGYLVVLPLTGGEGELALLDLIKFGDQQVLSASVAFRFTDKANIAIAYQLDIADSVFYQFGTKSSTTGWSVSPAESVQSPFSENLSSIAVALADINGDGALDLILLGAYRHPDTGRSNAYLRIRSLSGEWSNPVDIFDADTIQSMALAVADSGELIVLIAAARPEESPDVAGYCIVVRPSGDVITRATCPLTKDTTLLAATAVRYNPLTSLPKALKWMRGRWVDASAAVPRVTGAAADPDEQLLHILSHDASAREVYYRSLIGGDFMRGLYHASGGDVLPNGWQSWSDEQERVLVEVLEILGPPFDSYKTRPADERLRLFDLAFNPAARRFSNDLVNFGDQGLIQDIMTIPPLPTATSERSLRDYTFDKASLLLLMVRHGLALEYYRAANDLVAQNGIDHPADLRRERELIGMRQNVPPEPTRWSIFEWEINSQPIGEKLANEHERPGALGRYFQQLERLIKLPQAELERLFSETLDVFSHRIDAWITALAVWRLENMHSSGDTQIYVGAYGWVENLKPKAPPATEDYRGKRYMVQPDSGGYIHAPSLDHAAAAAILRNGHLSRGGVDRSRLAIDLSSERVRAGRELLDAVRQGIPLGAYLGYRVERRLHDNDLDIYIEPLRQRFPLVPPSDDNPGANDAARNVVDGLALRRYWTDQAKMKWGTDGLPATTSTNYETLHVILNGELGIDPEDPLDTQIDPVDAAADLLTAESVFQLVGGKTAASSAALDALSRGMHASDPEISRTLHTGTPLTHRIVLALDATLPPQKWQSPVTPRAALEPRLDAWVGTLLGDPETIACKVAYPTETNLSPVPITVKELSVRPLDMLAISEHPAELDQRVAYAALTLTNVPETVAADQLTIDYVTGTGGRTFAEILELARAINAVIGMSQPLLPKHLLPINEDPARVTITDEASTRAQTAIDNLDTLITTLDGQIADLSQTLASPDTAKLRELRTTLLRIADFGLAGAIPENATGTTEASARALLAQAEGIRAQARQRLDEAKIAIDPPKIIRALFKTGVLILPTFQMDTSALANEPTFDTGSTRETQIQRWLHDAARVRPALDKWRRLWLYLGAIFGQRAEWHIAQLPYSSGEQWIALPFNSGARPTAGHLSIALHRPTLPISAPSNSPIRSGLLLDEWPEMIPNADEVTGIVFSYDDPGAEPPQCVLIAVSPTPPDPDGRTHWSVSTLENILNETIDLAHARAVDGELVGTFGQLLPAMLLAANVLNDTISTTNYDT